jgi:hypothetical protein
MDISSRWYKAAGASIIAAGVAARYVSKWKRGRSLARRGLGDQREASSGRYYIGIDLTDPRSSDGAPKPCDVAVLDHQMYCQFSQWNYSERGDSIVPEIALGRSFILSIDGPQGLTGNKDAGSRQSELSVQRSVGIGIPGHTMYELPSNGTPFAGFISGSVKLFYRLVTSGSRFRLLGMEGVSQRDANLIEAYPGAGWRSIAGTEKLPRKDTLKGRDARRTLLEVQGVTFPEGKPPSTDQLDAAMAAWTAYCFDTDQVSLEGIAPWKDDATNVMREGYIVQPAPVMQEAVAEPPTTSV